MPNVALFKQDGTQNGEITLNEEIFGIEPNESVVYDATCFIKTRNTRS